VKSIPLYVGALLIAAAVAGAAMTLLAPAPETATPSSASSAPPPSVRARPTPAPTPAKDELSPEQVRAQDEEDIIEILLAQIEATPETIDEAWLAEMCRYVANADSLELFWDRAIARGQAFSIGYLARNQKAGTVLSRNPNYYVFEAREFIYDITPDEEKLRGPAQGLLHMALVNSWESSRKEIREKLAKEQRKKVEEVELPADVGELDDEVKTTFFNEYQQLYEVLRTLEDEKQNGNPRRYMADQVRIHEAAIYDRYLRYSETIRDARERYSGTAQSSKAAGVEIRRWNNAVNEHLLSLGKIYMDAALAEKAFRGRMQDYADLGFKALAMVYQRSRSGEALGVMREANRIQRYNLWQMARLAWKNARALAEEGRIEEADDEFLLAKHHYLQCLSRLERSKKPTVLDEYRRLQADITSWVTSRSLESTAVAGG
jgi:hypothetical protein